LKCAWDDIRTFLLTGAIDGVYGDSTTATNHQAQTWETYMDSFSHETLRQLPLHAAINHLAPLVIVKMLLSMYPQAVTQTDRKGNLPLHIAFMTNANDVSSFLLKVFPDGIMQANLQGKLPVECYHHEFNVAPKDGALSPMALAESSAEEELVRLERQVANDKHRMATAYLEYREVKRSLRKIRKQSRTKLPHRDTKASF